MGVEGIKVAVIGLGYVGLPIAVAFAKQFPGTIGFDISELRISELKTGVDRTCEVDGNDLTSSGLIVTARAEDLGDRNVFVVCVPTPIHKDHRPDLRPLESASKLVGAILKKGGIVIYESTVYPGITEEFCGPILAKVSGLKQGIDFKLGYSPERINPGDKEHTFAQIRKVVSAEDTATLEVVKHLYGAVVKAGTFAAASIKVAEAAKVIENTQRDINIALMNELAIICDRMGIRTKDVLEAARTKWNFLPFTPGLVGGHCIGVDPYYLTSKAEELGYHPEVILAGRRINDSMGAIIARKVIRFLGSRTHPLHKARVGILGVTFKEDIPDIRNSRIPDIIRELFEHSVTCLTHDPHADHEDVMEEYGLGLSNLGELNQCDALILAVPHQAYLKDKAAVFRLLVPDGVLIDVKSAIDPKELPPNLVYWSL